MRPTIFGLFAAAASATLLALGACQKYTFDYKPEANHQASDLHFAVTQPSKADLLFVIDNSGSMLNKQAALSSAIGQLLDSLAPQDTRYRIGITSTDAHGFLQDCNNVANPPVPTYTQYGLGMGAKGTYCNPNIAGEALDRPHDGTLGRLIAAYDDASFDPQAYGLADNPPALAALQQLMPTGLHTSPNPNLLIGEAGARWVIDREIITQESSNACNCPSRDTTSTCYTSCTAPVARALVQAYFLANVKGLGNQGFAWEEGLKSAMWAIGIDPENSDDASALDPAYNLTGPGGPNQFLNQSDTGTTQTTTWLRDDALLAILFLTDEQDCSMPEALLNTRATYETSPPPHGSICYQAAAQAAFHDPNRLIKLITQAKGGAAARVAVGLIGGVGPTSSGSRLDGSAVPGDCVIADAAVPSTDCACNLILSAEEGTGVANNLEWCKYTIQHQTSGKPPCDAMSGSRYLAFAEGFSRRTFESICRNDAASYGPALASFARIATQACFELDGIEPASRNPNLVAVKRTPKGSTMPPVALPVQPADSEVAGYYYDAANNKVCLTGLDRLIGDVYDIFIEEVDTLNYGQ